MAKQALTGTPRPRMVLGSQPTISGTPTVGQVLTCSPGSWSGARVTFSYQWIRDAATNVGTDSATYTLVAGDATHTIKCRVTANATDTNYGSATATSAPMTIP